MTENKQLADLDALRFFSPKFDKLFDGVRETVAHDVEHGAAEPTRYALGMNFEPVEEDILKMPKIVVRTERGEADEVMFLADLSDCFGRLKSGGVFPTHIPDWMHMMVQYNALSGVYTLNCTFYVPPLSANNAEEKRIRGRTREEHKCLAVVSYSERDSMMKAALMGESAEYKRHLMLALQSYRRSLSS